nr:GNAT family N-acetyltransferase [uncultured Lichenicoccus sp.]
MINSLWHRVATLDDLAPLEAVMAAAIDKLQRGFLDARQIAASRMVMGMDRQLILDGSYFVALRGGAIAGCGGWSRRATLFGGDHTSGRNAALLDPATDAARIRAMYTHPDHARRGVGRFILSLCETQARAAGFGRVELAGTLAGEPLYRACGYAVIERFTAGDGVPLLRMGKELS